MAWTTNRRLEAARSSRLLVVACLITLSLLAVTKITANELPNYKLCVPHQIFDACKELTRSSSTVATIECVSARDRMECLELVQSRRADFVAVDPEDMYVAFNMKNEDFAVFSEIRTREEADSPFRYLGIILVRRSSDIRSLADLKGRKSCHTGYGRNVGYKIPITKLKNAGVLKIADNPQLSYVEKELQGLTDLFSQSCLVGKYSPNAEVNAALKKHYSNLCALCENPTTCDYPDKYSGYDGAIRCLVENGGDVAFTKVIFVNRYFGLPVGNAPARTTAQANPDDYEYLCADGSRKPIRDRTPCTWAQRPWQAYMGNADVRPQAQPLQKRIDAMYTEGQAAAAVDEQQRASAAKLWIDADHVVVAKEQHALPGDHLAEAQYRDVIERDGNMQLKIRICVRSALELRKCDVLKRVAFARDIRPEFDCVLEADCVRAVNENLADVAVIPAKHFGVARAANLQPIAYETVDPKDVYVAVVPKTLNDINEKTPIHFDELNPRSLDVALLLRHFTVCPDEMRSSAAADTEDTIRVLRISQLPKNLGDDAAVRYELLCPDGHRRAALSEATECNYNARLVGNGIFARSSLSVVSLESYTHGFVALSDKFGHGTRGEEVFELFGEFEPNARNVLFGDDSAAFVAQMNAVDRIGAEDAYRKMHCVKV